MASSIPARRATPQGALPRGGTKVFGTAVAISGDVAVVTSPGTMGPVGDATVFTRTGGVWSIHQLLSPATGLAYAFREEGLFGIWKQEAQLTPTGGMANGYFGRVVAVSGDSVLVGAPGHTFVNRQGRADVFVRSETPATPCPTVSYTEQAQLVASDAGVSPAGAGYYFSRTGVWTEETTLVAGDLSGGGLGFAAALGATHSGAPRATARPQQIRAPSTCSTPTAPPTARHAPMHRTARATSASMGSAATPPAAEAPRRTARHAALPTAPRSTVLAAPAQPEPAMTVVSVPLATCVTAAAFAAVHRSPVHRPAFARSPRATPAPESARPRRLATERAVTMVTPAPRQTRARLAHASAAPPVVCMALDACHVAGAEASRASSIDFFYTPHERPAHRD